MATNPNMPKGKGAIEDVNPNDVKDVVVKVIKIIKDILK